MCVNPLHSATTVDSHLLDPVSHFPPFSSPVFSSPPSLSLHSLPSPTPPPPSHLPPPSLCVCCVTALAFLLRRNRRRRESTTTETVTARGNTTDDTATGGHALAPGLLAGGVAVEIVIATQETVVGKGLVPIPGIVVGDPGLIHVRDKSPNRPITLGPPAKRPSPNAEPPSVERDRRTVMCMQLSAKASPHDLEEFFQKVGQVCDVKMISDRNSRRSKGIAYVEFYDEGSVLPALSLTGQKLFGVPIIVQPTMAEKNRLAAQAQNLKKAEGPKKLYVGSLHYSINEAILKTIFEPFGSVEKIQIMRDENGLSKGYAFVEFNDSECAERAFTNMNGVELAGRPMKVNNVTERDTTAMETLDAEDADIGVGMTPAARAQLMAKLSDGHNAGLAVPQMGGSVPAVPTTSSCLMLSNMFDPMSENEPGWENDIRDDVLEECSQTGAVLHIYVDKLSQGNVYVKCANAQVASAAFSHLNGRFFAGKLIVVQYIPEAAYYVKFPDAQSAITPLTPLQ